jgi:YrbI family 3-deoxy-D-manno-octulosonate 8-phosphate phosphatase
MIKTIIIDCDGVLTDGRLTIDHTGKKMFKSFHTRDVRAIRELVFNGFEVIIVSADEWEGIHHFANKVGAEVIFSRQKGKLPYDNYIAIGDDAWDVPMLEKAKMAFCPSDADRSVQKLPGVQVVQVKGGCGVIAAILEEVLELTKNYAIETNTHICDTGSVRVHLQGN